MGILTSNILNESIVDYIKSNEWSEAGWGSFTTRETKNTMCYEKFYDFEDDMPACDFIYFPENWEGRFGASGYDVRGKCICCKADDIYVIPVSAGMDLNVFIKTIRTKDSDDLKDLRLPSKFI